LRRKRPQLAALPKRRIRLDPSNWPAWDCSVARSPSAANIAILPNRLLPKLRDDKVCGA
jgi:hypothetical protein